MFDNVPPGAESDQEEDAMGDRFYEYQDYHWFGEEEVAPPSMFDNVPPGAGIDQEDAMGDLLRFNTPTINTISVPFLVFTS